jgi:hypothetical protein
LMAVTALVFDGQHFQGFKYHPWVKPSGSKMLKFLRELSEATTTSPERSLYEILCLIDHSGVRGQLQATDARDLIFGVFGLRGLSDPTNFTVDYRMSVEEVFVQAATVIIHERGDLDILALCDGVGVTPERDDDTISLHLPSWVPDWSKSQSNQFAVTVYSPMAGLKRIQSNVCPYEHKASPDGMQEGQLRVRGCIIGQVHGYLQEDLFDLVYRVYASAPFGVPHNIPHLTELRKMLEHTAIEGDSIWQAELRLVQVCLQWSTHTLIRYGDDRSHREYVDFMLRLYVDLRLQGLEDDRTLSPEMGEFMQDPSNDCTDFLLERRKDIKCEHGVTIYELGKSNVCIPECEVNYLRHWKDGATALRENQVDYLMLSSDGNLLISNGNARAGDKICILHGCHYPVLLRQLPPGECQYVGGCFIEGGIDLESGRVSWAEEQADEFVLV